MRNARAKHWRRYTLGYVCLLLVFGFLIAWLALSLATSRSIAAQPTLTEQVGALRNPVHAELSVGQSVELGAAASHVLVSVDRTVALPTGAYLVPGDSAACLFVPSGPVSCVPEKDVLSGHLLTVAIYPDGTTTVVGLAPDGVNSVVANGSTSVPVTRNAYKVSGHNIHQLQVGGTTLSVANPQ